MDKEHRTTDHPPTGDESGGALHRSVAEALRRRLLSGALNDGSKLPALREMASEFEVSTMTIRQAIRTLEREGHIYRIPGVGAFVRPTVPRRVTAAQKMLAFAATDLSSAFEMGIARGIEQACQQRGWGVQILDAQHDPQVEARNMLRVPVSGSRGAIIIPTWGDSRCVDSLFTVIHQGFPIVLADRIPPGVAADFVESDHEQGAYIATRYLLEHGHRRVFMLTPPPLVSSIAARIQGYERALRSFGKSPRPEWMVWLDLQVQAEAFRDQRKWHGGYRAILPILRANRPPMAVFAVDPYTAWGVYEACRELSLRIPQDVSVVGFDDSEITMAMRPPITIVRQRTNEIGRAAVELLEQICDRPPRQAGHARRLNHVVVDVDLVERESVSRTTAPGGSESDEPTAGN